VYNALAAGNCDVIVTDDVQEYKRMEREHDNRQPFIEEESLWELNLIAASLIASWRDTSIIGASILAL
jgi:hypothetical protein